MKYIYLDYASLTPVDPRVQKEMNKWSREPLNPSSLHTLGVKGKKALDSARKGMADFLHAHPDEIVFTSGGTEANGLALEGAARAAHRSGNEKPHLIISSIEHSSIMETAAMMERQGVLVTRLGVDKEGLISLDELKKAIKPTTFMVSLMSANNEIGTIEPIREIAKVIRDFRKENEARRRASAGDSTSAETQGEKRLLPSAGASKSAFVAVPRRGSEGYEGGQDFKYPLLHTDACQAALYEDLNVEKLGVDLLTLDGSKIYGPRGIGALYVKRGALIEPLIYGGGQEGGLRSGTENIPAVMGFAKALELVAKEREKETARILGLREIFEREVRRLWPNAKINAANTSRVPHISNMTFPSIDAEMLVLRLDAQGVHCSTKSACLRDEDESYVLKSIGVDSRSSVRFSFGYETSKADLKKALRTLTSCLEKSKM